MADGAVNFLLDKLTNILHQKASLLGNVGGEVEEIKLELESMRSFIRDAERRMEMSDSIETWVRQVREVAYEVEDIVDEYLHHSYDIMRRSGFKGFFKEVLKFPKNIASRHQIATKLQLVKAKVFDVSERSKRYGFDRLEEGKVANDVVRWLKNGGSGFVDEDEIVGMEASTQQLVSWVTDDEPKRRIISIVGMGGLGKTTLVSRVYNNQAIKRGFDCCSWISVSQTNGVGELLKSMIKELFASSQVMVPGDLGSMSYRQLVGMLIDYLHQRKYFIVLDDVWSIDLWSIIRGAFPSNKNGSRIVLTTRNENVATSVGIGSHLHRLQPLEEKDAWTLFCQKVFSNSIDPPNELRALSEAILRKCDGLPLAIVALGGLLSARKKTVMEWKKVYDSLNWQLNNNPVLEQVKGILLLSFNDLPFYLKHCFLHCCVFRDGSTMNRKTLVHLWVAEGFVRERKGMTMEETAEEYLTELVLRSMIQVTGTNDAGRTKVCRVHDVMRELAVTTSAKENFCTAYDHYRNQGGITRIHRLSVYTTSENTRFSTSTLHHLRSFFVFSSSFSLDPVVPKFRLLRVLSLEGVPVETVPSTIVELFNLRYLNLRHTNIRKLPQSMERISNLQTLDVKATHIEKLPNGVSKLTNLRHLLMNRRNGSGLPAPSGSWNIKGLQTLSTVEADEELIQHLSSLTELKRLEITNLSARHGTSLCSSIQRMTGLTSLRLISITPDEELHLGSLHLPPLFLQKLTLSGTLKDGQLPPWISPISSPNLTHLRLVSSSAGTEFLASLHGMSSLLVLELESAFEGESLEFKAGQFPKLTKLKLKELPWLRSVVFEEGSVPNLRELSLVRCLGMKLVPCGIRHLGFLQKVHLEDMDGGVELGLLKYASENQESVIQVTCMK
ncbi:Disease resistance protein RPM1 [Linum perenne]